MCLYPKPNDWRPEPGDEDFEKEAFSCFLTGVSKNGVSEFDLSGIEPVKHGVGQTTIENWFLDDWVGTASSGSAHGRVLMRPLARVLPGHR